jgi:calcineurin-like phosphoesterase family protein
LKTSEEVDELIVKNWNETVKKEDIVYHLGDFSCGDKATPEYIRSIFDRLNGTIHFIPGNHDVKAGGGLKERVASLPFASTAMYREIIYNKHLVVLMHYQLRTWYDATKGSIHLFGHVHNKYQGFGRSKYVGVENTNYKPVSLDSLVEELRKIPVEQIKFYSSGERRGLKI